MEGTQQLSWPVDQHVTRRVRAGRGSMAVRLLTCVFAVSLPAIACRPFSLSRVLNVYRRGGPGTVRALALTVARWVRISTSMVRCSRGSRLMRSSHARTGQ